LGNYYSFVDCVVSHKAPYISFEDGAYVQLVLEKAYASDELGTEMRVEVTDHD
jgi:hypothetical protein